MNQVIPLFPDLKNVLIEARDRKPVTRAMVQNFEGLMKSAPAEYQVAPSAFTVRHHFSPGLYMRELHVPAGMVTTGKIHKHPCQNILLKGKRATLVDDEIELIIAPHMHLSPAGMKRISYTLEDAIWVTMHPNPLEKTLSELEKDLVCETEEEYQEFLEASRCLS